MNTRDIHRKAAFRTRRDSMTTEADLSTEIDLPNWYDRIEKMNTRHSARQRRRASRKKENRNNSGGDRSRFGGDPDTSRGARNKNGRAPVLSVAVPTKS